MAATLRAILPVKGSMNAKNLGGKKEIVGQYKLIGLRMAEGCPQFNELVDLRLYMGKSSNSSQVYASVWITGKDFYTTGYGVAGGYGYCKRSASADSALSSAGIQLLGTPYGRPNLDFTEKASIHGVGESAIREAILAIGEALGYDRAHLHLVTC
jgi:hypothetical protein